MERRTAIEEDVAALKRIVALLFALAGLAERAAGRSPAVRSLVVWLLRHGAAAAQKLVAGEPDSSRTRLSIIPGPASPADALQLAANLRALPMQIVLQTRLVSAACRAHGGEPALQRCAPATRDVLKAISALAALPFGVAHPGRAPDTS